MKRLDVDSLVISLVFGGGTPKNFKIQYTSNHDKSPEHKHITYDLEFPFDQNDLPSTTRLLLTVTNRRFDAPSEDEIIGLHLLPLFNDEHEFVPKLRSGRNYLEIFNMAHPHDYLTLFEMENKIETNRPSPSSDSPLSLSNLLKQRYIQRKNDPSDILMLLAYIPESTLTRSLTDLLLIENSFFSLSSLTNTSSIIAASAVPGGNIEISTSKDLLQISSRSSPSLISQTQTMEERHRIMKQVYIGIEVLNAIEAELESQVKVSADIATNFAVLPSGNSNNIGSLPQSQIAQQKVLIVPSTPPTSTKFSSSINFGSPIYDSVRENLGIANLKHKDLKIHSRDTGKREPSQDMWMKITAVIEKFAGRSKLLAWEKDIIWKFRYAIKRYAHQGHIMAPSLLVLFAKCVKWDNEEHAAEAMKVITGIANPSMFKASSSSSNPSSSTMDPLNTGEVSNRADIKSSTVEDGDDPLPSFPSNIYPSSTIQSSQTLEYPSIPPPPFNTSTNVSSSTMAALANSTLGFLQTPLSKSGVSRSTHSKGIPSSPSNLLHSAKSALPNHPLGASVATTNQIKKTTTPNADPIIYSKSDRKPTSTTRQNSDQSILHPYYSNGEHSEGLTQPVTDSQPEYFSAPTGPNSPTIRSLSSITSNNGSPSSISRHKKASTSIGSPTTRSASSPGGIRPQSSGRASTFQRTSATVTQSEVDTPWILKTPQGKMIETAIADVMPLLIWKKAPHLLRKWIADTFIIEENLKQIEMVLLALVQGLVREQPDTPREQHHLLLALCKLAKSLIHFATTLFWTLNIDSRFEYHTRYLLESLTGSIALTKVGLQQNFTKFLKEAYGSILHRVESFGDTHSPQFTEFAAHTLLKLAEKHLLITEESVPFILDPSKLFLAVIYTQIHVFSSATIPIRLTIRVDDNPNYGNKPIRSSSTSSLAQSIYSSPLATSNSRYSDSYHVSSSTSGGIYGYPAELGNTSTGVPNLAGSGINLNEALRSEYNPISPQLHGKSTTAKGNLPASLSSSDASSTTPNLSKKAIITGPLPNEYLIMFKARDDMRQDQLVMHLINWIDVLVKHDGVDMRLTPYRVLPLPNIDLKGDNHPCGILECVKESVDWQAVQYKLESWLREKNPEPKQFTDACENYFHSCAAYAVLNWVFGFGDRHSNNVMITAHGKLFHIDFGHIFGHHVDSMSNTPLRIFSQMIKVMVPLGKEINRDGVAYFHELAVDFFLKFRQRLSWSVINFIQMMTKAGLRHLENEASFLYMRDRLGLNGSEEEAQELFLSALKSAPSFLYEGLPAVKDMWRDMKH